MSKNKGLKIISYLTIGFILFPLILIVITAFNSHPVIQFPIKGFSFEWFIKVFKTRSLMTALSTSVKLALIAAFVALILGLLASYALSKSNSKLNNWLLSYFLSPNLIPQIVLGYALFNTLTLTFRFNVFVSLVLGHILVVLPYAIRLITAGLKDLDESIEKASNSLGATNLYTFFKIVLPNIKGPIIAAFMMSFINSFNNLPVSLFLKGPGINTLPVALMSHLEYNFDPTVSSISVIIMLFTLMIMLVVEKFTNISEVV